MELYTVLPASVVWLFSTGTQVALQEYHRSVKITSRPAGVTTHHAFSGEETELLFKIMKMSFAAMQLCVHSWFILTLWMVATKHRMAAARWKRMMKAKMINMAALQTCPLLLARWSGQLERLAGCFSWPSLSFGVWWPRLMPVWVWRLCVYAGLQVRGGPRSLTWKDSVGRDKNVTR